MQLIPCPVKRVWVQTHYTEFVDLTLLEQVMRPAAAEGQDVIARPLLTLARMILATTASKEVRRQSLLPAVNLASASMRKRVDRNGSWFSFKAQPLESGFPACHRGSRTLVVWDAPTLPHSSPLTVGASSLCFLGQPRRRVIHDYVGGSSSSIASVPCRAGGLQPVSGDPLGLPGRWPRQ
jgi:hypothetical protein